MSAYQHLTITRHGFLATVTLDRASCCNALNGETLAEIEHCALSFRDDADSRVVVFTGAGRHFSAGADLNEFHTGKATPLVMRRRQARLGERALHAVLSMDQITVAAWNGGALGGGACLATAMDFRVGAEDCFIQYPEIDLGLNLMWQSLPLTTRLLGPTRAKRLVIGGERIHAATLLEWGLLESVVPLTDLLAETYAFSQLFASKSPVAAQMIKRSVNQITGALDRALMHMDADQNLFTQTGADQTEAAQAYLDKRPPVFTGN
jgi:enoyl-CoA hydratase/carnithine racemase